jgi:hypothetical protein
VLDTLSREEKSMANLNGFSVQIPEAREETSEGYCKLLHGEQYRLRLHNGHKGPDGCVPADAEVYIDGKHVGTFRISYGQTMYLERSVNDQGRFTAYLARSSEGRSIGLDASDDNCGLIKVIFRPGKQKVMVYNSVCYNNIWYYSPPVPKTPVDIFDNSYRMTYSDNTTNNCLMGFDDNISSPRSCSIDNNLKFSRHNKKLAPAGTGLSGHSDQNFYDVEELDYNEQSTTIMLRLAISEDEPRPITCIEKKVYTQSTKYPRKLY